MPLATQDLVLNMGPQHPSTHGVLRLIVVTDGEIVKSATPIIGYLHRCKEKCGENLAWPQFMPYTDRTDYLAAMAGNLGYALAVEKLMEIEIPERVSILRVFIAELQRIASHLVAFGTYGIDIGAFTPFLWAFREREKVLNIFEKICGARLTYNYYRIGGLARDVPAEALKEIEIFCDDMENKLPEYHALLTYNKIFIERTAKTGVLSQEIALANGCTGPVLRSTGINLDIRKTEPYCLYENYDFNVPVGTEGTVGEVLGDNWNRYMVRLLEINESIKIIRQCLAKLEPEGPYMAKVPRTIKPPPGEVYTHSETPRGILGYYIISHGTTIPWRLKIRAPTFCNLSVLEHLAPGMMIADMIATLGSLDIVLGEVDR